MLIVLTMNFYGKKKRAYQFLASRGKKKSAFSQIPPFLSKTGVWREDVGGRLCCLSQNITNFFFCLQNARSLLGWFSHYHWQKERAEYCVAHLGPPQSFPFFFHGIPLTQLPWQNSLLVPLFPFGVDVIVLSLSKGGTQVSIPWTLWIILMDA